MAAVVSQVAALFAIVAVDSAFGFSPSIPKNYLNNYASTSSSLMKGSMFGHLSRPESVQRTANSPSVLAAAGNTMAGSDLPGVTLNRRDFFISGTVFPFLVCSLPSHAENVSSTQPVGFCTLSFYRLIRIRISFLGTF